MKLFRELHRRLRALMAREALDMELDEELRFHLDQQIAEYERRGMDPRSARAEALRLFGGVEKVKEECRDERCVRFVDNLLQDLSYAARTLRKTKGFAVLTVFTLALGIGANTAIFSVVNGVLLAPLPYPDGDELVLLEAFAPTRSTLPMWFSIKEFYELDDEAETLELVEYHSMSFTLLGHGYPSNVATGVVSHAFFDVLGVKAQLGRTFLASDETPEAEAVLVLSDRYWREEFDADPSIVGKVFELNDRPHRVIGVLPALPHHPRYNDVYMPTTACPYRGSWEPVNEETSRDGFRNLQVFGRLRPGIALATAVNEVEELTHGMVEHHRDYYEGTGYTAKVRSLQTVLTERARPMLLVLLGIVTLVLLVACANAANLMVARVLRREREMALRVAMGAGKARLIRQLLTESTLLSLAGGALGLVFAAAGLNVLVEFTARFTSRTQEIEIDGWVLAFTLGVSVVTGIAFGVLPALWQRSDNLQALREGNSVQSTPGRRTMRLRGGLIAAQVALSFMLLIGAGLMLRSLVKLTRVDPGFTHENVLTAQVFPNWSAYPDLDAVAELFTGLLRAIESGPGVVSAAVSNTVPFAEGALGERVYHVSERPSALDEAIGAAERFDSGGEVQRGWPVELAPIGVSADYFSTLGIPIVEGRLLTAAELDERAPVALLSESARRSYWPGESPLGRQVAIPSPDGSGDWIWHTIVGVVADARHAGLDREAPRVLYGSYRAFGGAGQLLVRTSTDAQTMSAYIQETLARIAPAQSVQNFQTYATLRSASMATPRLITTLLSLFAGLALLITVAGISGVVAYSVGQRTHEIGIRMALGAERSSVLGMVLGQGLSMALTGLALGFVGALWFGGAVASFLFRTEPSDPLTFIGVALVLLFATVVACLMPARRATSIDPAAALRVE